MARLRHFSYSFSANERILINIAGNVIRCTAGAQIFSIEPGHRERIDFQEGLGLTFETEYKQWVITNGATAQTITLYIGDGQISDSRQYGSITTLALANSTLTIPVDETIDMDEVDTIAANADRANVIIQADISNSDILRVGPVATATRGKELTPGASYSFPTTGALQVYSPADSQVYRVEEYSN